jgi:hypothetical protein
MFILLDNINKYFCIDCFREENVSKLLDNMLKDEAKNESVIVNGLSVIQTLLEFKKQG